MAIHVHGPKLSTSFFSEGDYGLFLPKYLNRNGQTRKGDFEFCAWVFATDRGGSLWEDLNIKKDRGGSRMTKKKKVMLLHTRIEAFWVSFLLKIIHIRSN